MTRGTGAGVRDKKNEGTRGRGQEKEKKKKSNRASTPLLLKCFLALASSPIVSPKRPTSHARRNLEEDGAGEGEAGDKGPAGRSDFFVVLVERG